jgi:hypothetical protein
MPYSRIVEGPQQRADRYNNDKGDKNAAEELELRMKTACPDIVLRLQVVTLEKELLQNIDTADREPAETENHRHQQSLMNDVVQVRRQRRQERKGNPGAGKKKDRTRGTAQVLLNPPAAANPLLFFLFEDAEQNVVEQIRYDDKAAEEEDGGEPGVSKLKGGSNHHHDRGYNARRRYQ